MPITSERGNPALGHTRAKLPRNIMLKLKGKTRKSSFLPEKAFLSQQEIKYILNSIFL
jgi:hypothetical protein